jgi:branched-subunit amino acid transport protein
MIWFWISIAGLVTFFTRYSMLAFVNPKLLSKTTRKILIYVPSAVFPAIIFPAVFLDKKGFFVSIENPQIWAFVVAVVAGYYFKNIILTISIGLISFWIFSYFFY